MGPVLLSSHEALCWSMAWDECSCCAVLSSLAIVAIISHQKPAATFKAQRQLYTHLTWEAWNEAAEGNSHTQRSLQAYSSLCLGPATGQPISPAFPSKCPNLLGPAISLMKQALFPPHPSVAIVEIQRHWSCTQTLGHSTLAWMNVPR